jgi:hypothetical protein
MNQEDQIKKNQIIEQIIDNILKENNITRESINLIDEVNARRFKTLLIQKAIDRYNSQA